MNTTTTAPALAALTLLTAVTAGCADPKAASQENFRKALEPVVRDAFCTTSEVQRLVVEGTDEGAAFPIRLSPTPPMFGAEQHRALISFLDDASKHGLLVRSEAETPARRRLTTVPFVRQPVVSYAVTEQGERHFRPVERRTGMGMLPFPAVCPARGELIEVVRWTEPADLAGRRVSQVTYSFRGVDPIYVADDAMRADLAKPQERTVPLVLASDGWAPAPR